MGSYYSSLPLDANFQFKKKKKGKEMKRKKKKRKKKKKKAWCMTKHQVSIQETDKSSSSVIYLTLCFSLCSAILLGLSLYFLWTKSCVALCPFSTGACFRLWFHSPLVDIQNCNSPSRFGTNEIFKYHNALLNRKSEFYFLSFLC